MRTSRLLNIEKRERLECVNTFVLLHKFKHLQCLEFQRFRVNIMIIIMMISNSNNNMSIVLRSITNRTFYNNIVIIIIIIIMHF